MWHRGGGEDPWLCGAAFRQCAFAEWPIFETLQDLSTTGREPAAVIGLTSQQRLSNGRQPKPALGEIGARSPSCLSPVHSCLDATLICKRCCRDVGGRRVSANAQLSRLRSLLDRYCGSAQGASADHHRGVIRGCPWTRATASGRSRQPVMGAPDLRIGCTNLARQPINARQKGLGQPCVPAGRNPEPSHPAAQGTGIDAEEPGERCLGEAPFPPEGEQALDNGCSIGPGRIPEEPNDARQEAECRVGPAELPVGDRAGVGAEPVGDLAREQAEVKPPLAQVISYRCNDLPVEAGQGSWPPEPDIAERQRRDAGRSTRGA